MTWLPLVFAVLSVIGYIVFFGVLGRTKKTITPQNKFALKTVDKKEETTASESNIVEALIKYKELVDKGIITEEEFNSIKENLLKI